MSNHYGRMLMGCTLSYDLLAKHIKRVSSPKSKQPHVVYIQALYLYELCPYWIIPQCMPMFGANAGTFIIN